MGYKEYEKRYRALKSKQKKPVTKEESASRRIKGKETSLKNAGLDPKKASDTRNAFEKLVNLPEDQNFLFDIFELLGRPQQAMFGAWNAAQKGEDRSDAAWEGFTGKRRTTGKDILNADEALKTLPGWAKTVGGIGMDVILDPVDWALIPATGGASLAAQAGVDAARTADKAVDAARVGGAAANLVKPTKELKSISDLAFRALTKGGKKAISVADTKLEDVLRKADRKVGVTRDTKKLFFDYSNPKAKQPSSLGKSIAEVKEYNPLTKEWENIKVDPTKVGPKGRFENYKALKNWVSHSFNTASSLPKRAMDVLRKAEADEYRAATELQGLHDSMDNAIETAARTIAETNPNGYTEKGFQNLVKKIRLDLQAILDRPTNKITMLEALNRAQNGLLQNTAFFRKNLDALQDSVNSAGRDLQLSYKIDEFNNVWLSEQWDYVLDNMGKSAKKLGKEGRRVMKTLNLSGLELDPTILKKKMKAKINLTRAEADYIKKITEKYKTDPVLMPVFREASTLFARASKVIDDNFLSNIGKTYENYEGYVRHAYDNPSKKKTEFLLQINDETFRARGNSKVLGVRKYNMSAREANNYYRQHLLANPKLTDEQRAWVKKNARLFEEDFMKSFDDYLKQVPKVSKENKILDEILVQQTFGDFKKANAIKKSISEVKKLGEDAAKVKRELNAFKEQREALLKIVREAPELVDSQKKFISSGVTKNRDLLIKTFKGDKELIKKYVKISNDINSLNKKIKPLEKVAEGKTSLIRELSSEADEYNKLLDNLNIKVLKTTDDAVPVGFKLLSGSETNQLRIKIKKISDELGLGTMKEMAEFLGKNKGLVAINKDILRLIEINTNTKEISAALRLYDKILNGFKKYKVLSFTFHINNLLFNVSNMWLAGISPTKQAELFPKAVKIFRNGGELIKKRARNIPLKPDEEEMLKIWDGFINAGFGDAKRLSTLDFRDMPDSLKKYFTGEKKFTGGKDIMLDGLPYLNNKLNIWLDSVSRLALYMEGVRNPKFLDELNVVDAGEAVRKVLFDPTDLSEYERNVMKRIVPFYTFTKKNLAYQMSNLGQHGKRYNQMMKAYKAIAEETTSGNYENMADFLKENMYIPIPGLGKNGEYTVLRAALPFGQLTELASSPISGVSGAIAPLIKAPIELTTNMNSFTGRPIESFEGQKSTSLPFLTKKQEYLLGLLTGLDTPAKMATRPIEALRGEGNIPQKVGNALASNIIMTQNVDEDRLYKMYDQLDKLEQVIKKYEQQGYDFSKTNELQKANKNYTVESIRARLLKAQNIKLPKLRTP